MTQMSQIVALSAAAAVSESMRDNLSQRLNWLEVAIDTLDTENEEIAQYAPKIIDLLIERLSDAYMATSQANPNDPILARIHSLVRYARQLKRNFG